MPDISDIRRGPVLRINRLPPSQSAATAAGRGLPKETREMWAIIPRMRKILMVWFVFFEVSLLNAVSSITTVIVSSIERGSPSAGVTAWAVTSGVFVVTFGILLGVAYRQYRNVDSEIASSEEWIEMHLRCRPLPPRPAAEEQDKSDTGAEDAWHKFSRDNQELRKYIEFVENRIAVLEEQKNNAEEATATNHSGDPSLSGSTNTPIGQAVTKDSSSSDSDKTIRPAKKLPHKRSSVSLARQTLLQADNSANYGGKPSSSSWSTTQHNNHNSYKDCGTDGATLPKSSTETSILTELCEAVTATEGYSPLAEQHMMPSRASVIYTPQTPNAVVDRLSSASTSESVSQSSTPSGPGRTVTPLRRHLTVPARAHVRERGLRSVEREGKRFDMRSGDAREGNVCRLGSMMT
ncbi:hypothetical protein VTI74DRAFT_9645 [Chaetomium olivicolor]